MQSITVISAMTYYRRIHELIRVSLGVMHFRGEATERNPVKAYALMKIANEGLNDEAFSKISSAVFSQLTDDQRREAEKLYEVLNKQYSIEKIRKNVLPEPLADEDCLPQPEPVSKQEPTYPAGERRRGRMGITVLEFTISPEGYPRDIILLKSTAPVFSDTSFQAAQQFQYQRPVDGKPIFGHRVQFTYQLTDAEVNVRPIRRELVRLESEAEQGNPIAQYQYASSLNMFRSYQDYLDRIDLEYQSANEWFTKSARGGLPNAQFEIGRNMIEGRGCKVDVESGVKWVTAAAIGGYSPAQRTLGQRFFAQSDDFSTKRAQAAMSWLRNAALSGDYPAKVLLAWQLATAPIEELRNGKEALQLLESEPENYYDDLRILETKAAAYAEIGDFERAVALQKRATEQAKGRDWDIPLVQERLDLYQHKQAYRGAYY